MPRSRKNPPRKHARQHKPSSLLLPQKGLLEQAVSWLLSLRRPSRKPQV